MSAQATAVRDRALLRPCGDIYQENDKVIVRMEMPGVAKSDLGILSRGLLKR